MSILILILIPTYIPWHTHCAHPILTMAILKILKIYNRKKEKEIKK